MTKPTTACHSCGSDLPENARFCTRCGAEASGPSKCPDCSAEVAAGSKFCTACGSQMTGDQQVASGNRWARRAGDFASRLEMDDLSAWLKRGVAVEEGTEGLLFQHGELIGTLNPGHHTLESIGGRLKSLVTTSPCNVVLVDVGDVELQLQTSDLRTSDDQEVDASLRLVVRMNAAKEFFTNLMKAAKQVTTAELSRQLSQQVLSVMQGVVLDCTATELYGNRELADRIEDELRVDLTRSLERYGLQFSNIEFVSFGGTAFDSIRKNRGELRTAEGKIDVQQQRAVLNKKFREICTRERMAKVQTQTDFDDFLKQVEQEAEVKDLLRKQEREELWRQYGERKEDHDRARQHMLALLELQQKREHLTAEYDYKKDLLLKRQDLDDQKRQQEIRTLDEWQQAELDRQNREHETRLKQEEAEHQSTLNRRRDESQLEHEETERATKSAMELQQQWEDMKSQRAEREIDRDLTRQRGEQEIRQSDADAEHQREVDRLQTLSSMSAEALIAASPKDQAEMLAGLKETEALKGLSEEQILARAAADSPEVANAFAEKFRSAGNQESQEQMQQMYERMLEQQAKSSEQLVASQQGNAQMLKDLMETALQTQRDTSVASAQGPVGQGPSVIYPPAGSGASTVVGSQQAPAQQASPVSNPPAQADVDCPVCQQQSPAGSQFCGGCGYRFS